MANRWHAPALLAIRYSLLATRYSARQRDHRAQAGRIVLQAQFAAVQMRDRGGEAQAQPRARLRAALLQPHEALDHAAAVVGGNAGPRVGDREQDAIPLPARGD